MHNSNNLNRLFLPNVAHDIGVKVPEAVAAVQELFVIVTDSRSLTQALKPLVNLRAEAVSSIRVILGYVEKDLAEVGFRFRSNEKAPLHGRLAFFLTRLRSWMSSRSSSNTLLPSS